MPRLFYLLNLLLLRFLFFYNENSLVLIGADPPSECEAVLGQLWLLVRRWAGGNLGTEEICDVAAQYLDLRGNGGCGICM
jgi:hypothetical protein